MTSIDQRRDQLDATAKTLDDIGMPTLANRLRETADELLPTDTAAARTPGQIAYEAFTAVYPTGVVWSDNRRQAAWESAAAAVIAHHEQQQTPPAPTDTDAAWSPVVGGMGRTPRARAVPGVRA